MDECGLEHREHWTHHRRGAAERRVCSLQQQHLVRLIPAVLVPDAQLGVVVEQRLAARRLPSGQHSVVERCQPSPVLVVRRRSERKQRLHM